MEPILSNLRRVGLSTDGQRWSVQIYHFRIEILYQRKVEKITLELTSHHNEMLKTRTHTLHCYIKSTFFNPNLRMFSIFFSKVAIRRIIWKWGFWAVPEFWQPFGLHKTLLLPALGGSPVQHGLHTTWRTRPGLSHRQGGHHWSHCWEMPYQSLQWRKKIKFIKKLNS